MLLQKSIQTQAEYMTTKGNSAWDKLCALVAKQPDTAKCNTEHGLTQLSTGLAVMSLSAVPKILKTPNTSNFPNDSAEQGRSIFYPTPPYGRTIPTPQEIQANSYPLKISADSYPLAKI